MCSLFDDSACEYKSTRNVWYFLRKTEIKRLMILSGQKLLQFMSVLEGLERKTSDNGPLDADHLNFACKMSLFSAHN